MKLEIKLINSILNTWQINNQITVFLVENLPEELWTKKVPGYRQKTIQMISGHIYNTRCRYIKRAGKNFDIDFPQDIDRHRVSQKELIEVLSASSRQILKLIRIGIEHNDTLSTFYFGAVHFTSYLIAHDAHHRGQIIMAARQLKYNLPVMVRDGLWEWSKRSKEIGLSGSAKVLSVLV